MKNWRKILFMIFRAILIILLVAVSFFIATMVKRAAILTGLA